MSEPSLASDKSSRCRAGGLLQWLQVQGWWGSCSNCTSSGFLRAQTPCVPCLSWRTMDLRKAVLWLQENRWKHSVMLQSRNQNIQVRAHPPRVRKTTEERKRKLIPRIKQGLPCLRSFHTVMSGLPILSTVPLRKLTFLPQKQVKNQLKSRASRTTLNEAVQMLSCPTTPAPIRFLSSLMIGMEFDLFRAGYFCLE